MFNLIVKGDAWAQGRDSFPQSRIFEYTEETLAAQFAIEGRVKFSRALLDLPTLFVQESVEGLERVVAHVGTILRATQSGSAVNLEYAYDAAIPGIPNATLRTVAAELEIGDFEFSRTHWAVKSADLFRVLLQLSQPRRARPLVFTLSDHENIEPSLVSAMMPFHPAFDRVYAALQKVSKAEGLRCRRADDIWENPAVIQDVVSLIDRSRVVIADCTGRNPNVFYEIGIAHTLGRDVILITQSKEDIPFDLRHLRFVEYLNNGEGLQALADKLQPRLADLAA